MTAVWLRIRSELRSRWKGWVVLSALVGLAAGVAVAAAAGARRSETAYPRFVEARRAFDVLTGSVAPGVEDPQAVFAEIERIPQVAETHGAGQIGIVADQVETESGEVVAFPDIVVIADPTGRLGRDLNPWKILEGRAPAPDRPDEAVLGFALADRLGLGVGDRLTVLIGAGPTAGADEAGERVRADVRVVGIEAAPGEFQSVSGGWLPFLHLTQGFLRAHRDVVPSGERDGPAIRLKRGADDLEPFLAEMERRQVPIDVPFRMADHVSGVQRSLRMESLALWVLCGLMAVAGVAVLGQALSREAFLESGDFPVLRSLGMSRLQLIAVGLGRAAVVATGGALVGVGVATLASPLTPIGLARVAEPDPGIAFNGTVMAAGAAATVVLVLAVSAVPAWLAARRAEAASERAPGVERRSAVAEALARGSMPPTAVVGVRMALEPGRGRTAVPVRTTVLGATTAIAALCVSFVFSASLRHLLDSPRLSGYTWDAAVFVPGEGGVGLEEQRAMLKAHPGIAAVALGGAQGVEVAGRVVQTFAFPDSGAVGPAMIAGDRPSGDDEIALGPETMQALGVRTGDTVDARARPEAGDEAGPAEPVGERQPGPMVAMRVVGRLAVPQFFFSMRGPGEGAAASNAAMRRLVPGYEPDALFAIFRPDANHDAVLDDLRERLGADRVLPSRQPSDVANLSRIAGVPFVLAAVLAVLAVGTLVQTLVSSVRRRRRDHAILKTLGFVRGQVRTAVAWQAATLMAIALAVGIPIGIAMARWAWRLFATQLAVVPEPVVPAIGITLVATGALAVAAICAVGPGHAAACSRPAAALRTE